MSSGLSKKLTIGLYLNAGLLVVLIMVLIGRNETPTFLPMAYGQQSPQPIAGGAGLFLMPGQLSERSWGCYIMDVDRQTLMVYQYNPGDRRLKLTAARDFSNDRRLRNFNTDDPTPDEAKRLADKEADSSRVVEPKN